MDRLVLIPLFLVLASLAVANGDEIASEICACTPTTYEFTLDFSLTCPPVNITLGEAVEQTSCLVSPFGNPNVENLVPVSVEGIDILELGQNLRVVAQTDVDQPLFDGDTFTYTSIVTDPENIENTGEIPRALQVNLIGINAEGDRVINVFIATFTNDCNIHPVFQEGQSAGWIRFTGLGQGSPEFCSSAPQLLDPVITPTLSPVSPTASPILSGPTPFPIQRLTPTDTPTIVVQVEVSEAPEPTETPTEAPEPTETPTEAPDPVETSAPTKAEKPTDAPTEIVKETGAPTEAAEETDLPTAAAQPDNESPTSAPVVVGVEDNIHLPSMFSMSMSMGMSTEAPNPMETSDPTKAEKLTDEPTETVKETNAPTEAAKESGAPTEDAKETDAPTAAAQPDTESPTSKPVSDTSAPVAVEVPTFTLVEIIEDDFNFPSMFSMSMSMGMSTTTGSKDEFFGDTGFGASGLLDELNLDDNFVEASFGSLLGMSMSMSMPSTVEDEMFSSIGFVDDDALNSFDDDFWNSTSDDDFWNSGSDDDLFAFGDDFWNLTSDDSFDIFFGTEFDLLFEEVLAGIEAQLGDYADLTDDEIRNLNDEEFNEFLTIIDNALLSVLGEILGDGEALTEFEVIFGSFSPELRMQTTQPEGEKLGALKELSKVVLKARRARKGSHRMLKASPRNPKVKKLIHIVHRIEGIKKEISKSKKVIKENLSGDKATNKVRRLRLRRK